MKACLVRVNLSIYWIDEDGKRHEGSPSGVSGDLSGVSGNLSGVYGNLSRVYGNLSGVSGDLSGVYGNLSRVYGNLDEAEITDEERAAGIPVAMLIKQEARDER